MSAHDAQEPVPPREFGVNASCLLVVLLCTIGTCAPSLLLESPQSPGSLVQIQIWGPTPEILVL